MIKSKYIVLPTYFILLIAGLGPLKDFILPFTLFFGTLVLVYLYFRFGRINLPDTFGFYLLFLFLAIAFQFVKGSFQSGSEFLWLFSSGGLLWVLFYNLKAEKDFENLFGWTLVALGLSFAFIYIASLAFKEPLDWTFSLAATYTRNHHHLGDFWTLPFLFLITKVLREKKPVHFLLIILGVIILVYSLSRSAYLSLFLGALVLFRNLASRKAKDMFLVISMGLALIFFFASLGKTTLFSRIYFLQGIKGFLKYPLGLGLGKFSIVSKELAVAFERSQIFSTYAHNLFLEVLIGMGVLGLSFLFWFFKVLAKLLGGAFRNSLYTAMFVALSVNFFFDTTYLIPGMFWLWFATLGLAQQKR